MNIPVFVQSVSVIIFLIIFSCNMPYDITLQENDPIRNSDNSFTITKDINYDGSLEHLDFIPDKSNLSGTIMLKNHKGEFINIIKYPFSKVSFIQFCDFNNDKYNECILLSTFKDTIYLSIIDLYNNIFYLNPEIIYLGNSVKFRDINHIKILNNRANNPDFLIFYGFDEAENSSIIFNYQISVKKIQLKKINNFTISAFHVNERKPGDFDFLIGLNPDNEKLESKIELFDKNFNVVNQHILDCHISIDYIFQFKNFNQTGYYLIGSFSDTSSAMITIYKFDQTLAQKKHCNIPSSNFVMARILNFSDNNFLFIINIRNNEYINSIFDLNLSQIKEIKLDIYNELCQSMFNIKSNPAIYLLTITRCGDLSIHNILNSNYQNLKNSNLKPPFQYKVEHISESELNLIDVLISNSRYNYLLNMNRSNFLSYRKFIYYSLSIILLIILSILRLYFLSATKLLLILKNLFFTTNRAIAIIDKRGNIILKSDLFLKVIKEFFGIECFNGRSIYQIESPVNIQDTFKDQITGSSKIPKKILFNDKRNGNQNYIDIMPILIFNLYTLGNILEFNHLPEKRITHSINPWASSCIKIISHFTDNKILENREILKTSQNHCFLKIDSIYHKYLLTIKEQLLILNISHESKNHHMIYNNTIESYCRQILQADIKNKIDFKFRGNIPDFKINMNYFFILIDNIVSNSIEAISDKGMIEISGHSVESPLNNFAESIEISISDNGSGIIKGNEKSIFEPGFTTKTGHLGIGLSIAKEIINSYEGDILINSSPGIGTTVTFQIPLLNSNIN